MGNPLDDIEWLEWSEELEQWKRREDAVVIRPIKQGLEAEVIRLELPGAGAVLKIWNKTSRPDVRMQYHLLRALGAHGVSVPQPLGRGQDREGHAALLTAYSGEPVARVNARKLEALAALLHGIHQIPPDGLRETRLPKYDFAGYFYPGIEQFPDLTQALDNLIGIAGLRQDRLIHGDFHLGNIVEQEGRLAVIDWTNGQWGDARYDLAWSYVLALVYLSDRHAAAFREAYLTHMPIDREELALFEAIACLRWLLLRRKNYLPDEPSAMANMWRMAKSNIYLGGGGSGVRWSEH